MYTVLGSRGFIGRNLVSYTKGKSLDVSTPEPDDLFAQKKNHGHVVYCIGLTADFRERPFATMDAHVALLTKILETVEFESFTYLSSTRVYQGASSTREDEDLIVNPNNPSDLYNISKLAGESLCLSCGRENTRVVRLSNVVGHDESAENFLQAIIKEALQGNIHLRAHPESEKDFITMSDAVSLLFDVASKGRERLYNLASGQNTKFIDLLEQLSNMTGCTLEIHKDGDLQLFPPIVIDRIKQEFGYQPQNIVETLPSLVKEYTS